MRRLLFVLLTLTVALLMPPTGLNAHPADMMFQTHTVAVTPTRLTMTWSILPGPVLVPSLWAAADTDRSGTVAAAEARAWAAARLGDYQVTLDDEPVALRLVAVTWPATSDALALGDASVVIELEAAVNTAGADLSLHNTHQETISSNFFIIDVSELDFVTTPEQTNGQLHVHLSEHQAGGVAYWETGALTLPGASGGAIMLPDRNLSSFLSGVVQQPERTVGFTLIALFVALALGAIHALTPGHGKGLVGAYLVGARGTARHAIALGSIVTLTHTGSVLLFGVLTLTASRFLTPTTFLPLLEIISGTLIIILGLIMIRQRWRGWQAVRRHRVTGPATSPPGAQPVIPVMQTAPAVRSGSGSRPSGGQRTITVGKSIDVSAHLPQAAQIDAAASGRLSWKSLIGLGVSGGLVPCPDAIAILLVAAFINQLALGLSMIVAFSLGLALVLIGIGLVLVRGRDLLGRFGPFAHVTPVMPLVSAALVTLLGIGLVAATVRGVGLANTSLATVEFFERAGDSASMTSAGNPEPVTAPPFDPASARVIYITERAGLQLEVRDLATNTTTRITDEPYGVTEYAVSPSGSIVYSAPGETGSVIKVLDTTTGAPRDLLTCTDRLCRSPRWSPDERTIIYEQITRETPTGTGSIQTIWWLDVATGATQRLLQDDALAAFNAHWSPDGDWLAYVLGGAAEAHIRHRVDTRRHSFSIGASFWLNWSPAGDSVLFTDFAAGAPVSHLFRFDLRDGSITDLTADSSTEDIAAVWSPDGSRIATVRQLATGAVGNQIWLLNPDGSDAHQLTTTPNAFHEPPVWSPGNDTVLVTWRGVDNPLSVIGLIEVETGGRRLLVTGAYNPAWLPNCVWCAPSP